MHLARTIRQEVHAQRPEMDTEHLQAHITHLEKIIHTLTAENTQLRQENETLKHHATEDVLTGVLNRRGLFAQFEHFLHVSERENLPPDFSIIFIDIKGLKKVNDTEGHAAGDTLIKNVATYLITNIRPTDICARWGGDEFVIVLPHLDEHGARHVIEHIIAKLPQGIYIRSGIVASQDIRKSQSHTPSLNEAITHADTLAGILQKTETRIEFRSESNTLCFSEIPPQQLPYVEITTTQHVVSQHLIEPHPFQPQPLL